MRNEKWFLTKRGADYNSLSKEFGLDPLVMRLIRNRGIIETGDIKKYLNAGLDDLYDYHTLGDMDLAADILCEKIEEGLRIRVVGDYDVDGIMSTYILTDALRNAGASVDYVIPHRIADGYGLNVDIVKCAASEGVDTLLTCDNGISAYNQIETAVNEGLTCIITDHHDVPFQITGDIKTWLIPPADAVIDPKIEGCGYPFDGICGAVVAMKLMQALYEALGRDPKEILDKYLAMAAIATIVDVMELKDENRIIVKWGLKDLNRTDNIGLRALIQACGVADKTITPYIVGFVIGPCLNAAGRLDTAKRALELLLCKEEALAFEIAAGLRALNEERKDLTSLAVEEAYRIIEEQELFNRKVIVLYMPEIHESIAGLVAGRIKEEFTRPVYVLTDSEGSVKGSGRSIPAYSMYEELSKCKELFTKFGGHPMAAGLSLEKENLKAFMDRIEEETAITFEDLYERVDIDADMPFGYVNKKLIEEFSVLEPCGNGNRRPVFARKGVKLKNYTIKGKNNNVGYYRVTEDGINVYELVYFGEQKPLIDLWNSKGELSIIYYPDLNEYNGQVKIQLIIKSYR